jgi:hypothetical protein
MPKVWEKEFPNLGNWICSSKATTDYNCTAFAVGDETRRWEPYGYYWPAGLPQDYSTDTLIEAYKKEGFEVCDDGAPVEGREKIVIYTKKPGVWEHVARQEPDGRWKSKLGDWEDIIHEHPESLICADYGTPEIFMERARSPKPAEVKEAESLTPSASSGESPDPQADVSNPSHREDFNSLLNAAARKREPKD